MAHADLNAFIDDLNISVQGDIAGYKTRLGARFDKSSAQVEAVLNSVDTPAEAAVVFWLGERAGQPADRVLEAYHKEKAQGWGAVAKNLGIKPGSPTFHALKNGDFQFHESRGQNSQTKHNKPPKNHRK